MNKEEIDRIWFEAMRQAAQAGQQYTRYHFANLVAQVEREACAALLDANAEGCYEKSISRTVLESNAAAIRARNQQE